MAMSAPCVGDSRAVPALRCGDRTLLAVSKKAGEMEGFALFFFNDGLGNFPSHKGFCLKRSSSSAITLGIDPFI
jgi:hypothetical protein